MRSVWNLGQVVLGCWMAVVSAANLFGQPKVLTWHNDNSRTGQNLSETILTPANVNSSSFEKLFTLSVDGKVDAQPLYVPGLTISGAVHNVLYVVTEHDSVYAFDADNGTLLKSVWLLQGTGESPSDNRGCGQVTPEIGITATPVIDPSAGPHGTIYVVAMSRGNGYFQRIHALDLTTLAEEFGGPVDITATYSGTGDEKKNSSDTMQTFSPGQHEDRAALLLSNGVVYTSWSSHCDFNPYTSWIIGYVLNGGTLTQAGILNLVPNGSRGAIWGAGSGPAADSDGNLYTLTGNGTFDSTLTAGFPANGDYGNAFVKISTSAIPPTVVDYFTMSNTTWESNQDLDFGSGGLLLLPPLNDSLGNPRQLAVGTGKDSNIYVVDRTNMGKIHNPDNIYQKLTSVLAGGVWASPAWFNGSLYYGAVGNVLKQFTFANGTFGTVPASQSLHAFGFPGTTPSISANGTTNGIVWVAENTDPAVLHAYDATNLNTELYNSNQAASNRDHFGTGNKFIVPMIVNGKVYVGTTNGVGVFGLKPVPFVINATAGTPQSQFIGSPFATTLAATVLDNMNTPVSGAQVTFTAPSSGASGTFANGTITTQAMTNVSGVATATVFTANATTGDYNVTAAVTGVVAPANFSLTNKPTPSGGTLAGSVTTSAAAVNLTTEGTTDWEHWGEGSVNHKAAVVAQLSNYSVVGGGSTLQYSNDPRPINWTDGTPTVTGTNNKNGVYISSVGHGFSLTAPADTTVGTLIVHVGGWNSGGTLTAHLSDGTAPDYVNTTPTAGGQYDENYTLTYAAASAGQTLTVTWKMASGSGNVTFNAVALNKGGGPPPPPPPGTITATAGTPQNATVSTPFALALQATVKDGSNNPVNGATVTFTAPATGASGTFSSGATATATTNPSGVAVATTFTANATAGGYMVAATVPSIPTPANFNLTNTAAVAPGSLSGIGNSSAALVNLTSEGTTDWTHWGENTLTRKTGVPAKLTDYTIVGGGGIQKYNNDPRPITWTDGTPTASSTNNKNGVYINSIGHGFSFTAPADTTTRTLIVHVGGWNSGGTLTAQLSDGSHAPFADTTPTAGGQYDRNYTLTYAAGAASQTLTVTWKMASGSGNVTLNAAALQ